MGDSSEGLGSSGKQGYLEDERDPCDLMNATVGEWEGPKDLTINKQSANTISASTAYVACNGYLGNYENEIFHTSIKFLLL